MVQFEILTKCECEQIIERKFSTRDFQILDFKSSSLSTDKLGFLGEYYRLHFHILIDDKPVNFTLFCKQKLTNNDSFSKIADDANCYEREIFYLELVTKNCDHRLLSWIPLFYLARNSTLFVVDDMGQYDFILPKNQIVTEIDFVHTKVLFKSLAKMHAFSFILEQKNTMQLGREFSIGREYKEYLVETLFNENVKGWNWVQQSLLSIENIFKIMPVEERLMSFEKFKRLFETKINYIKDVLMQPSKTYPNVLCHGDLWLNNLLYKYDNVDNSTPIECCLIDFQLMRYLPPVHDIYFYLYINTTREFRQKHTAYLLKYYYELLTEELKLANIDINNYYTWHQFIESGKEFIEISKFIAIMYKSVHLLGEEYWKLFATDIKFLDEFAYHNRSKFILDWYEKSEQFRMAIHEMMRDVQESLLTK